MRSLYKECLKEIVLSQARCKERKDTVSEWLNAEA